MSQYVVSSSGREVQKIIVSERGIALDGISVISDMFVADGEWSIDKIKIVYTTAANISGVSYGVSVMLGTFGQATKFATWNSAISASAGQVVSLALNTDKRLLSNNDVLTLRTFGTLQGAGMISVYVYLSRLR